MSAGHREKTHVKNIGQKLPFYSVSELGMPKVVSGDELTRAQGALG